MKVFRNTKSEVAKNENGEHGPFLEIMVVVLIHCNVVNNNY